MSPRRKAEIDKGPSNTNEEKDGKKKKTSKTKTSSKDDKVQCASKGNEIKEDETKEDKVIDSYKPQVEKKNTTYYFPSHEETFIKDDRNSNSFKVDDPLKDSAEKTCVLESKPSDKKKKLSKSPRRTKPIKVQ